MKKAVVMCSRSLGLEDADELFTRGKIGIQVLRILRQRDLKQREIYGS
ncbi:hypothetical protein CAL7102_00534 [Dulcicalothrix desertica PCC 7102]|nr:hypothetical protein [Dulcicalothrix desertica]TWH61856.1 hypothetical protein CAL7102_00534 [Dulcicalothrix desertica PCC 7102]